MANADTVAEDLKTLAKDTGKMAKDVKQDAIDKSEDLSKKCIAFIDSALAAAKDVPAVAAARTKEAAVTTDDYVHKNPWRAVTISAGIGLVLGVIMSKR
tara:strand:+ start:21635 stop:21931 length:297 start_codon:yes stop_codon:yes gene_type:complete